MGAGTAAAVHIETPVQKVPGSFSRSLFQTSSSDTDYILTFSLDLSIPTLRWFGCLSSTMWYDMICETLTCHSCTVFLSTINVICSSCGWRESSSKSTGWINIHTSTRYTGHHADTTRSRLSNHLTHWRASTVVTTTHHVTVFCSRSLRISAL